MTDDIVAWCVGFGVWYFHRFVVFLFTDFNSGVLEFMLFFMFDLYCHIFICEFMMLLYDLYVELLFVEL